MKKVLVAYYSVGGNTEKIAQYIGEGIRFSGQEAVVKSIKDVKATADLAGYDGFIFGSPTYFRDAPEPMKTFLFMVKQVNMEGKLGGAFGTYSHDVSYMHEAYAPAVILDTLQYVCKMEPFELGPLMLKDTAVGTGEGIHTSQDYGRVFGEKLNQ
jgi:flavodoxin